MDKTMSRWLWWRFYACSECHVIWADNFVFTLDWQESNFTAITRTGLANLSKIAQMVRHQILYGHAIRRSCRVILPRYTSGYNILNCVSFLKWHTLRSVVRNAVLGGCSVGDAGWDVTRIRHVNSYQISRGSPHTLHPGRVVSFELFSLDR